MTTPAFPSRRIATVSFDGGDGDVSVTDSGDGLPGSHRMSSHLSETLDANDESNVSSHTGGDSVNADADFLSCDSYPTSTD